MDHRTIPTPLPGPRDGKALTVGAPGNTQRLAFDTLLRRELMIGDPNDAASVAAALLERYQGDARAQAIGGEAQGLPFLNTPARRPVTPVMPADTATSIDLTQARTDVEKDFAQLLSSNLTKDVRPELEGWQQTLFAAIDEGVSSARQSLDPYLRDRAFAARRRLTEYARLARMVGIVTTDLNESYRNLAQSLDEVSAVLLVLMGEALANTGFQGGRTLLRVPYSELQARRDQVLVCLRNMSAVAQEALDQSTMPRGLMAYRVLHGYLEDHGQPDLRALLSEGELARAMDEMIHLCAGGSSDGLRRVGATAWNMLGRFSRFVQATLQLPVHDAPPLLAFQDALQLFIDGFEASGGLRLLRIARPSVLMYGLYGGSALTRAERRLMGLVNLRGHFASKIDCVSRCDCDTRTLQLQCLLDRVLFDMDRAIDLYASGTDDFGIPEQRAAAYAFHTLALAAPQRWVASESGPPMLPIDLDIRQSLQDATFLLMPGVRRFDDDPPREQPFDLWNAESEANFKPPQDLGATPLSQLMHAEMVLQLQSDRTLRPIVAQMSSGCIDVDSLFGEARQQRVYVDVPPEYASDALPMLGNPEKFGAMMAYQHGALLLIEHRVRMWFNNDGLYQASDTRMPPHSDTSLGRIADSLSRRQNDDRGRLPSGSNPPPVLPGAGPDSQPLDPRSSGTGTATGSQNGRSARSKH